jgi:two-component system, NtrC family, sensor kinase
MERENIMESGNAHITALSGSFDDEIDADSLLSVIGIEQLESLLNKVLYMKYQITNKSGQRLFGALPPEQSEKTDIIIDFEHLLTLETWECNTPEINVAQDIIKTLAHSTMRYLMTAKLHIESINEDFSRLEEKNRLLEASEQKYQNLCNELEHKVQDQVTTIKHKQHQLYQADKLACVGQLAAGIAHEINTPLCYMQGNINTSLEYASTIADLKPLLQSVPDNKLVTYWEEFDLDFILDDLSASLTDCLEGINKTSDIICNLKTFSNVDRDKCTTQSIDDIALSTCNVFSGSIGGNITLQICTNDTPPIDCNPGFIGQAILNILMNAAQSIGESKGGITLTTGIQNPYVYIRIEDTGAGIPAENLDRIFEPFFTTKDVGGGTGLGLSVVNDISKAHDGYLDVNNSDSHGAIVTIFLRNSGY